MALAAEPFAELVDSPGVTLIDVRTLAEFASGHIADAINIDFQSADFSSRVAALPADGRYALYCRSGNRSGQARTQMLGSGFTHVSDLAGGIGAWTAAGKPLVNG